MMDKTTGTTKQHSGKWTLEEEAYVEGLMEEFRAGTLDLQEGTTLRSFLAQKLNCKPKRISKKYEGKNYDGKQLYWKTEEDISSEEMRGRRAKLQRLESKFKECLKAIEIVKASRQPGSNSKYSSQTQAQAQTDVDGQDQFRSVALQTAGAESPLSIRKEHLPSVSSPSNGSAIRRVSGGSGYLPGSTARPSLTAAPASAVPGLPDLYRGADANALGPQFFARQRQLEAMELAAALQPSNRMAGGSIPAGTDLAALLGSSALSTARQEALLGLSGLNRPVSPSASLGLAFNRPPSPSRTSYGRQSGLLEQAAVLEQARLRVAAARNNFSGYGNAGAPGPAPATDLGGMSFNSMLELAAAGRRHSTQQSALEESFMRFQQPVREMGAAAFAANGSMGDEESALRKRMQNSLEDLQQLKRQRFM